MPPTHGPGRFLRLSGRVLPWLVGAAVLTLGIGLPWALFFSPPDWQQGETVRILHIHVPMAWLAMGGYAGLAVGSFVALVWRHPLADLAPRDVVAKAIMRRMFDTGRPHMWLDARHLGADFWARRFPTILKVCREHGVDP